MKKNKINIILIILVLTIYHLGYHYFSTSLVAQERRAAVKEHGANWLIGKDYDHTKKRFVSVKQNRGGYGNGTKNS